MKCKNCGYSISSSLDLVCPNCFKVDDGNLSDMMISLDEEGRERLSKALLSFSEEKETIDKKSKALLMKSTSIIILIVLLINNPMQRIRNRVFIIDTSKISYRTSRGFRMTVTKLNYIKYSAYYFSSVYIPLLIIIDCFKRKIINKSHKLNMKIRALILLLVIALCVFFSTAYFLSKFKDAIWFTGLLPGKNLVDGIKVEKTLVALFILSMVIFNFFVYLSMLKASQLRSRVFQKLNGLNAKIKIIIEDN